MTFIVPGEVFPTRFRSTAHGLSAGADKLGTVFAQALIGPLRDRGGKNKWLNHVMEIIAAFMVCGLGTTLLIPETKRQSVEYMAQKYHDDVGTGNARSMGRADASEETSEEISEEVAMKAS
ncbi:Inorganic phosphate transporter pho84 [Elasticomyces elasticus]|nr:Inorganic phosphate transporter pho84 [Elasticomyces elasticus]